jgi:error-prone DNA polymerase
MTGRGISGAAQEEIVRSITSFALYGFPESHSASFALIVYASAYLKRYHPAAFACALLNSQPMGFYPPRTIVEDAMRHGVAVRPIDVQSSEWDCTLEAYQSAAGESRQALRLGMRLVKGLGESPARAIFEVREKQGPFTSLHDLQERAMLHRDALEALAGAAALRSVDIVNGLSCDGSSKYARSRRLDLFAVRGLAPSVDDLLWELEPNDLDDVSLPEASPLEEVIADYQAAGLSLRGHPIGLIRDRLDRLGVLRARDLLDTPSGGEIAVAGIVLARQRPATASGVVFMSLEDETGMSNIVVWPRVFDRYRRAAAGAATLLVKGKLERAGLVVNLVASEIRPLAVSEQPLRARSRDFC